MFAATNATDTTTTTGTSASTTTTTTTVTATAIATDSNIIRCSQRSLFRNCPKYFQKCL